MEGHGEVLLTHWSNRLNIGSKQLFADLPNIRYSRKMKRNSRMGPALIATVILIGVIRLALSVMRRQSLMDVFGATAVSLGIALLLLFVALKTWRAKLRESGPAITRFEGKTVAVLNWKEAVTGAHRCKGNGPRSALTNKFRRGYPRSGSTICSTPCINIPCG